MEPLTITRESVLKAYQKTDENGKELLKSLFKDVNIFQSITERIKTFEDACSYLNIDPVDNIPANFGKHVIAYCKLVIITKALNEGWLPDWDNDEDYKWYLWFSMDKPGFRLYGAAYCYTHSYAGSRLCFRTRELAEYAASQFKNLYEEFFTL
jgi:hypothetical protein